MTAHDVARALPDVPVLWETCRSLAMLEAILCPDWEQRQYSFDSRWAPGEELASMRNGSGDSYSIVFSAAGAFIRGFDHESPMSPFGERTKHGPDGLWPGLIDSVPEVFADCVAEPAFSADDVLEATVCLWRQEKDDHWQLGDVDLPDGDDPDGASRLFALLVDGSPEGYQRFAEQLHERPLDVSAIRRVFALEPLTDDLIHRLNETLSLTDLEEDLDEIGYPGPLLESE
jgi:hypothetical protein